MTRKPRILNVKTVSQTKVFTVEELQLQFSNGTTAHYERITGNEEGAVLVVPMLDPRTVLLVREYAAGTDRLELSLPKGRIERGEAPLDAANREMMEEIGYGARELRLITSLTLAPGYIASQTHVVLAQDLYPKRLVGDEPEQLEVVQWPLDQINALLHKEDFSEARSLAALYLVRDVLSDHMKMPS